MRLHYPRRRGALLFLALPIALAALVSSVVRINAAGPMKLGLAPVRATGSNFVMSMQPGESRDLAVRLANYGAETVLTRTFAADAYSMVNGGFAVRLDGEPSGGTTNWLTYPAGDLPLAPGEAVERTFTVAVPAATAPGEYLTSIVLQNADATSGDAPGQSGMVLKQIIRQVVAVVIDVPGPRTAALALGVITHSIVADRSMIAVLVNNLGNVRLSPAGEFLLWDRTGAEVTRFPITMDTVYAHTATLVEVPFSERLQPGDYTAQLDVSDPSGVSATSNNLLLTIADVVVDATPASIETTPSLAPSNQTPRTVQPPEPTVLLTPMIWVLGGLALLIVALGAGVGVGWLIRRRPTRPGG